MVPPWVYPDPTDTGIRSTARKYGTTVKTVRKWLQRYEAEKKAGLIEQSRRPHSSPRATKPWIRFKLKQAVKDLQRAGKRKSVTRLKQE
ncbi:leucine zipper domain-containing protein [Gracilinema caldarium]|uniref:helix-turn-helix domain-containing protein n=1 Tax=Gracilinema caldarium TaxID=215591 RepID=UPI0026E949A1|nr:leucine zipper domain-containing protein [Gracilinema caldarium]